MAFNYIGNPDYRGYLNYISQKSGNQADRTRAALALGVVGNDASINQDRWNDPAFLFDNDFTNKEDLQSYIGNTYRDYQQLSRGHEGGGSGGGSGGGGYDPGDLQFLNDQESLLREMLGRTDARFNQGLTGLEDSYNQEVSGANARQSQALRNYGIKREDTTRDKRSALGKVDTNARTLADSVRRILGMASGSGSSAFQLAAPNAVARQASQQRSGVVDTFGRNLRDIDVAENDTKVAFEELLQDLLAQRRSKESGLRSGFEEERIGLDNSLANVAADRARLMGGGYNEVRLAQAPHLESIRNRQNTIDSLFDKFRNPYTVKPVDVRMPDLSQYTVDRAAINANREMGGNNYSPYAQWLKRQRGEEEDRYF